jgi:hypothetical protein
MIRSCLALAVAVAAACSSSAPSKPAGTATDPVDVCERLADVCRLDGAQLGVCIAPPPGPRPDACGTREPCLVCVSQH